MLKRTLWTACLMLVMALTPSISLAQEIDVQTAQQFLEDEGYSPGPVDGLMGPQTRSALRQFQEQHDLAVSGELDISTQSTIAGLLQDETDLVENQTENTESPPSAASSGDSSLNPVLVIMTLLAIIGGVFWWRGKEKKGSTSNPVPPDEEVETSSSVAIQERLAHLKSNAREVISPAARPLRTLQNARTLEDSTKHSKAVQTQDTGTTPPRSRLGSTQNGSRPNGPINDVSHEKAGAHQQENSTREETQAIPPPPAENQYKSKAPKKSFHNTRRPAGPRPVYPPLNVSNSSVSDIVSSIITYKGSETKTTGQTAHGSSTSPPQTLKNARLMRDSVSPARKPSPPKQSQQRPQQTLQNARTMDNQSAKSGDSGWVPKGKTIKVSGRNLGGMIYVGIPRRIDHYGEKCRAYIDPTLSVAGWGGDLSGEGMSYWPNYSNISAKARATYLDWLATGRNDASYNPGYMFLYFYGLERRFFVDGANEQEKRDIIEEVQRLKELYAKNHSAQNYLGSFLDAAGIISAPDADIKPVFYDRGYGLPLSLSIAIGTRLMEDKPLTAEWALSWLSCHPETGFRTPAYRCTEEFQALFKLKFNQRYPEGMKVRKPARTIKTQYRAASSEFTIDINPSVDGVPIPDISSLRKPVSDAQKLADEAMEELDKYSRFLGRTPEGRGTMEAQALLPAELWPLFPSEELEEMRRWASTIVEHGGMEPLSSVVEMMEGQKPDKITKRNIVGAADALARLGFGMAPDPRFGLRSPKTDDPVVLFTLPEGESRLENVSSEYRIALMELAIGCFIAQIDGEIVEAERQALRKSIDQAKGISPSERCRLGANLEWYLAVPPDMAVLRKRLKEASDEQRETFKKIAISMAHADAVIKPAEVSGIEKIYKALGMDVSSVYTDLHSATFSDRPIRVKDAEKATRGEEIPAEESTGSAKASLDVALIAAIKSDTEKASALLGNIFGEDQEDGPEEEDKVQDAGPASPLSGLDATHAALTAELLKQARWSPEEFDALAQQYGLMPAGCLEAINEWAYDRFDDVLLEEYDGYEFNTVVLHQMNQWEQGRI